MALPSVVQHLRALENSRIVASGKVGRGRYDQLNPGALTPMPWGWMSASASRRRRGSQRLEVYLAEGKRQPSGVDPST